MFTLLLHGTIVATTRGRPRVTNRSSRRRRRTSSYYGRLARPVGLLDRQGRRAAVRPPRGGAAPAHTRWPTRSPRTRPGRSTPSSAGSIDAVRRNTLVDVWRCYELWSLVGELRDVPGAILEVGVWRGGTGALMAARAARVGHRRPGVPLRHLGGRRQDRRRRHVLPRRQARRRVARDRPAAASRGSGSTNVELPAGRVPRRHRRPRRRRQRSACATSTSTSTGPPRTSSSGCGRGCRQAASSCSTTTASRRARASRSSSTSSAMRDDRLVLHNLNGHGTHRQALRSPRSPRGRTASIVDPTRGRPVRRLAEQRRGTAQRLLRRRRGSATSDAASTRASRGRSSTPCAARSSSTSRSPTTSRRTRRSPPSRARSPTCSRRSHPRRSTSRCASRCSSTCGIRKPRCGSCGG